MQGTLAADGTTASYRNVKHVHVHVEGSFGGGTFTVQYQDEAGTWRSIANAGFNSSVDKVLDFPVAKDIRGSLAGSTAPSVFYSFT